MKALRDAIAARTRESQTRIETMANEMILAAGTQLAPKEEQLPQHKEEPEISKGSDC